MDKYDRCAAALMELGDSMIAEKKRKSARIRSISFSVSGLCAAVLICIGIWKIPALQTAPEIPQLPEIVTVTTATDKESATVTATTAETSTVETSEIKSTAATAAVPADTTALTTVSVARTKPAETEAASSHKEEQTQPQESATSRITETVLTVQTTQIQTETAAEHQTTTKAMISQPESPETPVSPSELSDNFTNLNELGGSYIRSSGSLWYKMIDSSLKNVTLTDTTMSGEISCDADLYSMHWISQEAMIAVKLEGTNEYLLYRNYNYKPETLGQFLEETGAGRFAVFKKAYYTDLSNGYQLKLYTVTDSNKVMDILLGSAEAECFSYSELMPDQIFNKLSFEVDMTSVIPLNASMGVSEEGYLTTNLTFGGLAFNIGKEKAEKLIRMITENEQYIIESTGGDPIPE